MKSHDALLLQSPTLLSLFIEAVFFSYPEGLAYGSPRLHTLNCNSLLVPNEPIFAGEVFGYLFDLGQFVNRPKSYPF